MFKFACKESGGPWVATHGTPLMLSKQDYCILVFLSKNNTVAHNTMLIWYAHWCSDELGFFFHFSAYQCCLLSNFVVCWAFFFCSRVFFFLDLQSSCSSPLHSRSVHIRGALYLWATVEESCNLLWSIVGTTANPPLPCATVSTLPQIS